MVKKCVKIAYLYKPENLTLVLLKQLGWHGGLKVTHNTVC